MNRRTILKALAGIPLLGGAVFGGLRQKGVTPTRKKPECGALIIVIGQWGLAKSDLLLLSEIALYPFDIVEAKDRSSRFYGKQFITLSPMPLSIPGLKDGVFAYEVFLTDSFTGKFCTECGLPPGTRLRLVDRPLFKGAQG